MGEDCSFLLFISLALDKNQKSSAKKLFFYGTCAKILLEFLFYLSCLDKIRNMSMKSKISQKEKVDIIFRYLFDGKSHIEEEKFWNALSNEDINQLESIKNEPTMSFSKFKSSL